MKNLFEAILGASLSKYVRICTLGCIVIAAQIGASAGEGQLTLRAWCEIWEGKGLANTLTVTVVLDNKSNKDVFLPTRNLGPLVTFSSDKPVEFMFAGMPKWKADGTNYIESECDFSPVLLKPGESAQISASAEIARNEKIQQVTVIYSTTGPTGEMFKRYKFSEVELTTKAEKR
jgi:hypothetical protein